MDNLTVTKDATIIGNMYFSSTAPNGGGTATGGTITTNGNYRIHTFTNVGTTNFVVPGGSLTCDVLIVAGGGGGGSHAGGGGGAGGLIYTSVVVYGDNTVTVGDGGAGGNGAVGVTGINSVFSNLTAYGGGGGGAYNGQAGLNGGSGGGGGFKNYAPGGAGGSATNGQGFAGGIGGGSPSDDGTGGGGGGSVTLGSNSVPEHAGKGGNGSDMSAYFGTGVGTNGWFSGGGGGGANGSAGGGGYGGAGGSGGGGKGFDNRSNLTNTAGIANTGGGGGGGGHNGVTVPGKDGGSGIVIVRYPITTSSNVTTLSISSNGISQTSASGSNVFMGNVGIGTNNPAEQLHVVGNARVDGTNIVSAITLGGVGGETRSTWPAGNLSASSNLADIADQAVARTNLGLGTAATNDASAFDQAGAADAVDSTLSAHTANTNNPHQVTAAQAGALTPTGNGSQLTGITAAQVGALAAANNLSDVTNQATARANLGLGTAATNEASAFLSSTGGVVNGEISLVAPAGDIPMGVYTNQ